MKQRSLAEAQEGGEKETRLLFEEYYRKHDLSLEAAHALAQQRLCAFARFCWSF